jgi:hypothetical protein
VTHRLVILVAAAAFAAAAQSGGAVSGRVINSVHSEPVSGAIVTLRGIDDATTQTYIARTASDGRFSIPNMAPGTYEPRPSKTGYEQRTPGRFATEKEFPPVTVEAGKAAPPIELRLIPDGVIAGRVVDSDGDPVRWATVETQQYAYVAGKKQLQTRRAASTDDRGQYRLFHLPPGRYYLRVEPGPGRTQQGWRFTPRAPVQNAEPQTTLAPAFYPGATDVSRATELQLPPGIELASIDIRLTPERLYSISGHIAIGGAKDRISVMAQEISGTRNRNGFPMSFDGDRYVLSGIPAGKYMVIGQQFPGPQQPQSERQNAVQKVDIVDRDVEHVDLTFSPGATIKGVVKAEGSASVKDITNINLAPEDQNLGMFGAGARVAADGTFTLTPEPGIYYVRLNGPQVYLKAVLTGKETAPDRKIDTAHLSGDLTLVVASDFGKVEGTVVDDAGKPVYNADVTLIPDQGRGDWQYRFRSTLTKADGKFTIVSIQPGDYRAYAWVAVEQGAPQDAEFRKPFEDRAVVVKVEGNSMQTLSLKAIQQQ